MKEALDKASTRQMLRCYRIGAVIRLLLGGLLIGCNRRPATYHRENGWYHVVNTNADGLVSHTGIGHADVQGLVETTEHADLRELGDTRQKDKTQRSVGLLEHRSLQLTRCSNRIYET